MSTVQDVTTNCKSHAERNSVFVVMSLRGSETALGLLRFALAHASSKTPIGRLRKHLLVSVSFSCDGSGDLAVHQKLLLALD